MISTYLIQTSVLAVVSDAVGSVGEYLPWPLPLRTAQNFPPFVHLEPQKTLQRGQSKIHPVELRVQSSETSTSMTLGFKSWQKFSGCNIKFSIKQPTCVCFITSCMALPFALFELVGFQPSFCLNQGCKLPSSWGFDSLLVTSGRNIQKT